MRLAILSIGTELTLGQILNKNAQELAEKLSNIGFEVVAQLTVPDDRKLIQNSLEFLNAHAEVFFITGGLGPTADDFTREVIADWANKPLVFDEASYDYLKECIAKKNSVLRPAHKRQCFFPEGFTKLINSAGTAHGFLIKNLSGKPVYVLPGPPAEIASIWQNSLSGTLESIIPSGEKWKVLLWQTQGAGESEIAHLAEPIFEKYQLPSAYRASRPIVEVKLHFQEKHQATADKIDQELRQALKEYLL